MTIKQLVTNDLIHRNAGFTFTETVTNDLTFVEFKNVSVETVNSYTNSDLDTCYQQIRSSRLRGEVISYLSTTTQRDALTSLETGQQIFNITDGEPQEFDGTVWVSGGGGGGGTIDLGTFDANDAIFPSSNPAVSDSRNSHPIIAFDDTIAESILFSYLVPENYIGGDINIDIDWVAETATTGGVTWGVEFETNAPGGNDIDSDSFAAQQTGTSTTNGTSGIITRTIITLTQAQADSIAASDAYRMRIQRVVGDGGDDMVGDAQIIRISGRG